MSGAMGGSASEEFLVPTAAGEDAFVRCTTCDYAANVEAVRVPVPPDQPIDDAPAAVVLDTPDTPTIATLVDELNERDDLRRPDRRMGGERHVEERRRVVAPARRHPRAIGDRRARRPGRRRQAAGGAGPAGGDRAVHGRRLRRPPRAGQGLHRPDRARLDVAVRDPLRRRPAHRHRHEVGDGRQRARAPRRRRHRRSGLRAGRRPRRRRRACRRRLPGLRRAGGDRPRASRSATSSSSAAGSRRRSG